MYHNTLKDAIENRPHHITPHQTESNGSESKRSEPKRATPHTDLAIGTKFNIRMR